MNGLVLKGVVGDAVPIGTVFRGTGHFLIAGMVIVLLLIAFPDIVLHLPAMQGCRGMVGTSCAGAQNRYETEARTGSMVQRHLGPE
jgi:hypothetical protein